MPLPVAVKVYALAVAVLGGLCLAAWLAMRPGALAGDWPLAPLFAVLNAAATIFPLRLAPNRKITVASVVHVAALLLFAPPLLLLTIGVSTLVANLVLKARGRRGGLDALFNTGQHLLSLAVAGLVLGLASPRGVPFVASL